MINVGLKDLLKAVKTAGLAADPKSTMPILSCVHMHASDGVLTVRATDLQTDISVILLADGELDTVVGAKSLAQLLAACLPKGKKNGDVRVDLSTVDTSLVIGAGATMKVASMKSSDFPAVPTVDLPDPITYHVATLTSALDFILPAVSCDETRYHLNGMCFDHQRLVSTDGHRLHMEVEMPDVCGQYILPRRSGVMLGKVLVAYAEETTVGGFASGYASFTAGMATVTCKLVDAQFPPVDQVIPRMAPDRTLMADRASFLTAIRQASKLSCDRSGGVRISVGPDCSNVEASNPDLGDAVAPFTVDVRVEHPFVIGVNGHYIEAFLDCLSTNKVTVEMNGELDPIKIVDGNRTGVIMPMRI